MSAPSIPSITPLGGGWFLLREGTRQWRFAVAGPDEGRWVFVNGSAAQISGSRTVINRRASAHADEGVMAPMPATVIAVTVSAGRQVKQGDTLVVLEAMKMELPLRAPRDGVIKAVHCAQGDLVQPGVSLMELA